MCGCVCVCVRVCVCVDNCIIIINSSLNNYKYFASTSHSNVSQMSLYIQYNRLYVFINTSQHSRNLTQKLVKHLLPKDMYKPYRLHTVKSCSRVGLFWK